MTRPSRPASSYFERVITGNRAIAHQGARENITGAQTQSIASQAVTGIAGGLYSVGIQATTTLSASATGTSITVASVADISVGSVLIVGSVAGGALGGDVQWVTAVDASTNIVTLTPGLVSPYASTSVVAVVPAIVTDCYTSQGSDGFDLGTNVMATASASMQWSAPAGSRIYIAAMRTGFQYAGLDKVRQAVQSYGPQLQQVVTCNPGLPVSGWTNPPTLTQTGAAIVPLEAPSPWFTTTLTSAVAVGNYSYPATKPSAITNGAYLEAMIGDADEPAELAFGSFVGGTAFNTNTTVTSQFAHASGTQLQAVTSTGVSNWTFFPVFYVNSAVTTTFSNLTFTIDPR